MAKHVSKLHVVDSRSILEAHAKVPSACCQRALQLRDMQPDGLWVLQPGHITALAVSVWVPEDLLIKFGVYSIVCLHTSVTPVIS